MLEVASEAGPLSFFFFFLLFTSEHLRYCKLYVVWNSSVRPNTFNVFNILYFKVAIHIMMVVLMFIISFLFVLMFCF